MTDGRQSRRVLAAALVAGILLVPHTGRAACAKPRKVDVRVSVQAAEIAVRADYSIADLARLAGVVAQRPSHRVLGFYANTVGFTLDVPVLDTDDCADVTIDVRFIAQQRVIELASDLNGCLYEVALKHYGHHAALHAEALAQSGRALQSALRAMVADQAGSGVLQSRVRAFVAQWLDEFQATAPALQTAADSPAELDALSHACST